LVNTKADGAGRTRLGAWLLLLSLFAAMVGGTPASASGQGWFEAAGNSVQSGLAPQRLLESSAGEALDPLGGVPPPALSAQPPRLALTAGGASAPVFVSATTPGARRAIGGNRARAPPLA
jgi:hypothetical protein